MKKLISLTLVLMSMMLCLVSCTPTNTSNNSDSDGLFEEFSGSVVYNNIFYYSGKADPESDDMTLTIKYHNLDNMNKYGIPLYGDVLGTEDDPFKKTSSRLMIIDKKATEENNGLPVLLIIQGYSYDSVANDLMFQIISFNTATNRATVIADKITDVVYGTAYLKDDDIYFTRFIGKKPGENGYDENAENGLFLYKISKHGGEMQRYDIDRTVECYPLAQYDGYIYFQKGLTQYSLYRCDKNFENVELVMENPNQLRIYNEYVFWSVKNETKNIEGNTYTSYNYYKRPIDNILDNSKDELVLENVDSLIRYYNDEVFYCEENDIDYKKLTPYDDTSVAYFQKCYSLNIVTGEKSVLYDFTHAHKDRIKLYYYTNSHYIVNYTVEADNFLGYTNKKILVNRETGKETPIDSMYD